MGGEMAGGQSVIDCVKQYVIDSKNYTFSESL